MTTNIKNHLICRAPRDPQFVMLPQGDEDESLFLSSVSALEGREGRWAPGR